MRDRFPTVAVVGATGAVGLEALAILAERGWPAGRVAAFASSRSAGKRASFGAGAVEVEEFGEGSCAGFGIALFCADAETARRHAPAVAASGTVVVDNSAAFRMDPGVPLIVPEVNGESLAAGARLVANPNCSTVMLVTALEPVRRAFGIRFVSVATYQAVSGAGLEGIEELRRQTRGALAGRASAGRVFPQSCAFNVFPHESAVDAATGLCGEERKMIDETRRIWGDAALPIAPLCVRVPVVRAHAQAVMVELPRPARLEDVERALAGAPGVRLFPRAEGAQPTPLLATGRDEVLVGRVRLDESGRRLSMWTCCDQLRKGAALNALQIAGALWAGREELVEFGGCMRRRRDWAGANRRG